MATILDRPNPVPMFDAPEPRFKELLAARRAKSPSNDIDVEFRRIMSREFVGTVEDATVETNGWVTAGGALVPEATSMGPLALTKTGRPIYSTMPALRRKAPAEIPAAVSLADPLAANYAHFLDLILGRIPLSREVGIGDDVPLLLPDHVAQLPFVLAILSYNPWLARRVISFGGPIRVRKLFIVRASIDAKVNSEFSRTLVPSPRPTSNDRLLLVRSALSSGRGITNQSAVADLCKQFGFVMYDPGADTLIEQATRFSRARYVVSPHGAGLANIMFRAGGDLSLLELFHQGIIRDPFLVMANHYGFSYDAVV